jgi:hypothetical protein
MRTYQQGRRRHSPGFEERVLVQGDDGVEDDIHEQADERVLVEVGEQRQRERRRVLQVVERLLHHVAEHDLPATSTAAAWR